jgi:hypothetical protein
MRHWFAPYGHPGVRLPKCIRCGAPNPPALTTDDWDYLLRFLPDLKTRHGERVIEDPAAISESLENLRDD